MSKNIRFLLPRPGRGIAARPIIIENRSSSFSVDLLQRVYDVGYEDSWFHGYAPLVESHNLPLWNPTTLIR